MFLHYNSWYDLGYFNKYDETGALEVVRTLGDELTRQKGQQMFNEKAEAFSNLVYEQPDSLKPAAEKFGIPLQTTGWIAKAPSPEQGALANPKLLNSLFSPDSVKSKRNTDAVEVAPYDR